MDRLLLDTTDTQSDPFSPGQLWFVGIDTYSGDAVLVEWQSPGGVWIELGQYTSTGRWLLNAAPGDTFRVRTSTAGARVWGKF